jgi:hypothetical protein
LTKLSAIAGSDETISRDHRHLPMTQMVALLEMRRNEDKTKADGSNQQRYAIAERIEAHF